MLFAGFLVARHSVNQCLLLTFIAGLLLNCNWSIVSDMTMYIVVASRRSFASAIQARYLNAVGKFFGSLINISSLDYYFEQIFDASFVESLVNHEIPADPREPCAGRRFLSILSGGPLGLDQTRSLTS